MMDRPQHHRYTQEDDHRTPPYLYMLDEDLYRIGNAASPKLAHVRTHKDVDTYERNGIVMVRSNGGGISLITEERLQLLLC